MPRAEHDVSSRARNGATPGPRIRELLPEAAVGAADIDEKPPWNPEAGSCVTVGDPASAPPYATHGDQTPAWSSRPHRLPSPPRPKTRTTSPNAAAAGLLLS